MTNYGDQAQFAAAMECAVAHAPFLRRQCLRRSDVRDLLAQGRLADALAIDATPPDRLADIPRWLRRRRAVLALALAIGDLAGALPFEAVTAQLSAFADQALDLAIRAAIDGRVPGADAAGFVGLALGKHGSGELNYSSDIDPILLFDPAHLAHRPREEPGEAAERIARRVVEILQARDADGYVLRVDLRLRPSPEATPPALPIGAALGYYESSALPWERAAFIRARAAAGDVAMGADFLRAIRGFVWRRSLDYGAIAEIRGISRRIRGHADHRRPFGAGFDLKRGRGGIREIEFFAQIHQLIHGGREPALRAPATLDALAALARAGRIDADEAADLAAAYRLFRTVEHRLQMVDDQQTHRLPADPAALDNVARLGGWADGAELLAALRPHVDRVGAVYDALDEGRPGELPRDAPGLAEALGRAGFAEPGVAAARISGWRGGGARAVRSEASRSAIEALLPGFVSGLGCAADPDAALGRFDMLVGRLPSALNLFRLLEAEPSLARVLRSILIHAPALADALARRPALLDGLLDATIFAPAPDVPALVAALGRGEAGDDYQALLDRVRVEVGERRFALGVQLIEHAADPLAVAAGYARVAEAAIEVLARAAVIEFERVHGRVPGGELVILALGRLGGGALTHASDLDLVYLFTGEFLATSDGVKPLGATHYFNRLATRVSSALSVPTASGPLYDVDTRLRPSGAQGLLAVSTDSFALYQAGGAWTWERMALTRARPVFGSARARNVAAGIVADALRRPTDPATLIVDARGMRGEIARHKPPAGEWDVKLLPGGLVDLEFAVHVQQLRHAVGLVPGLGAAIEVLVAAGLLAPGVVEAHALLTRLLVTLRLVSPGGQEAPEGSRALVANACGYSDWTGLARATHDARALVRHEWAGLV